MHVHDKVWLCATGFALVYYVGITEQGNQISGMEMLQSNIYYYYCYVRIEGVLIGGPKNQIMII